MFVFGLCLCTKSQLNCMAQPKSGFAAAGVLESFEKKLCVERTDCITVEGTLMASTNSFRDNMG